jgi:hypothetical protein
MNLPTISLEVAMQVAAAIAAIGIVWDAAELIGSRTELLDRFFQWRVVRSRYYVLLRRPLLSVSFNALLSGRVFNAIVLAHAVAAVGFVFVLPYSRPAAAFLAAFVLLGHLAVHLRLLVGLDGADQMQTVVWAGLFVFALDLGHVANLAAAVFICAQLILSYVVSGSAKLVSRTWRDGSAIARITRANTYCSPGVSRVLQTPSLSFLVGWSVIAWEVLGALALTGGHFGLVTFLVLGLAFHIAIALTMGLTTFVFAFVAAYPVLYSLVLT